MRQKAFAVLSLALGLVLGWLYAPVPLSAQNPQAVRVTSVVAGTAATSLGKAEDASHTSGDTGVMALAIRQDTASTGLGADGDYAPLRLDASGYLQIICKSGCSGGTQYAEDAAHSSGDSTFFISGIRRDTTPSSSSGTAGDYSAFNLDGNGRLYVNATLYNSSGSELTPSSDQTLDAAIGTTGPLTVGRGSTATPTAMSSDGDATALWLDLNGRVHNATEGVEDAAETAAGFLAMAGSVRRDTAASSAGTTGDNATINTDALGLLWTRMLDPCSGVAKTVLPVNISTATTTEITPSLAGASTNYYICGINLVAAGADNVALVDDDTDNCASVTSGLAGGTSASSGWNLAANGGLTLGNGLGTVAKTNGTNRVVCLVTSAAVQLSGTIVVAAAP